MTQINRTLRRISPNGDVITIKVQPADQYTGLALLEIQTQVYSAYEDRLLDPRTTQLFMPMHRIVELGKFLASCED